MNPTPPDITNILAGLAVVALMVTALLIIVCLRCFVRPGQHRRNNSGTKHQAWTPPQAEKLAPPQALAPAPPQALAPQPPTEASGALFQSHPQPHPEPLNQPADSQLVAAPAATVPQKVAIDPAAARILTRTGENPTGRRLRDPYADQEMIWSDEDKALAGVLYREGLKVFSIARRLGIDQRQVAIHLTRVLFDFAGEIDDRSFAPRNGKTYTEEEVAMLKRHHGAGLPIGEIAAAMDRTVLGVGWRMIDLRMP